MEYRIAGHIAISTRSTILPNLSLSNTMAYILTQCQCLLAVPESRTAASRRLTSREDTVVPKYPRSTARPPAINKDSNTTHTGWHNFGICLSPLIVKNGYCVQKSDIGSPTKTDNR